MIQANELRVGNHFIDGKVESITTTGINFYSGYEGYIETPIEQLQPLPITPEILEKCGFVEMEHAWFKKEYFTDCMDSAEKMAISYNIRSGRCSVWDTHADGAPAMVGKSFEYLHQLQNLYFALTGEELNVQL